MGGLLHSVQRGGDWAGTPPNPLLAVPTILAVPNVTDLENGARQSPLIGSRIYPLTAVFQLRERTLPSITCAAAIKMNYLYLCIYVPVWRPRFQQK